MTKDEFIEKLQSSAKWDVGVPVYRTNPLPLDNYSVFGSYSDAEAYLSNPVCYPGQILAVVSDGSTEVYKVIVGADGALSLANIENSQIAIEANPSETTDTLTSIGIAGTNYEISGSKTQTISLTAEQYSTFVTNGYLAITGDFDITADKVNVKIADFSIDVIGSKANSTSTHSNYSINVSDTDSESGTAPNTGAIYSIMMSSSDALFFLQTVNTVNANNPTGNAGGELSSIKIGDQYYSIPEGTVVVANPLSTSSEIKTITIDGTSYSIAMDMLEAITQSDLRSLRDAEALKPGTWYRITDYTPQIKQFDIGTALGLASDSYLGYFTAANLGQFDIILPALATNKLGTEGYCIAHEGDTYFSACDLSKWKVWADLDGDILDSSTSLPTKYANAAVGSLWVYRLQDEWNNILPYDFKNIKVRRYKATHSGTNATGYLFPFATDIMATVAAKTSTWTIDSADYIDLFTFTAGGEKNSDLTDASLTGIAHDNQLLSEGNSLIYEKLGAIFSFLPSNQFNDPATTGARISHNEATDGAVFTWNTFEGSCYDNNFSGDCYLNVVIGDYYYNSVSGLWNENSFAAYCESNNFSGKCYSNSFIGYCKANTFSGECYSNSFSGYCYANVFAGYFYANALLGDSDSNVFNGYCYSNSFFGRCFSNNIAGRCYSNTFGDSTQASTVGAMGYCRIDGYFCNNTFSCSATDYTLYSGVSTGAYSIASCTFAGITSYITVLSALHDCSVAGRHLYLTLSSATTELSGLTLQGVYEGLTSSYSTITETGLYFDSTRVA